MPSDVDVLKRPDQARDQAHACVTLIHRGYGMEGPTYDVRYKDATIVSGSRDPDHDAARSLLAMGITGRMTTMSEEGKPRMYHDIERAARLSVVETSRDGLQVVPYRGKGLPAYRDAA